MKCGSAGSSPAANEWESDTRRNAGGESWRERVLLWESEIKQEVREEN